LNPEKQSSLTVTDVGEVALIQRIAEILGHWGNEWLSGSDDVVVTPPLPHPSHNMIVNTDMLVRSTDVPPEMTLYQAGKKAVVMNVSDLYVKGVKPTWAVVSLGLPPELPMAGDFGFDALIMGLRDEFTQHHVDYLGGDLNQTNDVIISITVGGSLNPTKLIRRGGARIGDKIVTTGLYGLTGVGLDIVLGKSQDMFEDFPIDPLTYQPCLTAVYEPQTDKETGPMLAEFGWASASADSSDGLIRTITEICKASNVGVKLDWGSIPISPLASSYSFNHGLPLEDLVLSAGEEFTHVFTIPSDKIPDLLNRWPVSITVIGEIVDLTQGLVIQYPDGEKRPFQEFLSGYEHFR
jgi:thiamine-monophosphate kinase